MTHDLARRALVALVVAGLAGCGTEPAPPGAPPIRLLDLVSEVEVLARPATEVAASESARLSRILRPRDREYLARIALRHTGGKFDDRVALLIPAETTLGFGLELERPARLRFGLGRVLPGAEATLEEGGPPVRAIARLTTAEGTRTIVDEELTGPLWSEWAVELDMAGPATLELTAEGEPGTAIAWSEARIEGAASEGWDLMLISLDTLRADHLGCYGYERPTSPYLDALAAKSFRFSQAFSSAPWTRPSHESLFSGLYPVSHGELSTPPLASVLWRAGYSTLARTGGGVMDFRMGSLAQGFETYREHDWIRELDALEASLSASPGGRRFFFLHTYEPHDPYIDTRFAEVLPSGRLDRYFDKGLYPPMRNSITAEEKRYVEALYDGDIAYTDEQLGKLLDRLDASGMLERTIVVITSDHGEQFWEHGSWRHGQNLYDEQIHVPLIIRLPEGLRRDLDLPRGGRVIDQQVRHVDLYPTILELLGIPLDRPVQGRSLVPLLRGEPLPEVPAFAEYPNLKDIRSEAVRFRGFKFLQTRSFAPDAPPERYELYDLRRDPAELTDLVDERVRVSRELLEIIQRLRAGSTEEGEALDGEDLDEDLRRDLEALGYIGGG